MSLERKEAYRRFTKARKAEILYSQRLRGIARQVGQLVRGLNPDGSYSSAMQVQSLLNKYADLIQPWATKVAGAMVEDVVRRDRNMWHEHSQRISRALKQEILNAPTGETLRELMNTQVTLITSIPREAAQRVHEIAIGNVYTGDRPDKLVQEILKSGEVAESRARTIARTETSRAASNLLQARAEHVGSEGYIWRTSHDLDVRSSHRKMEGRYVRWGQPPTSRDRASSRPAPPPRPHSP